MKTVILLMGAVAAWALWPAAEARADLADYAFMAPIAAGNSVTDLVVTPDNRWVLTVDRSSKSLQIVDTWNFALLAGSTAGVKVDAGTGAVPLCLAVSPDGQTAFVGLSSGQVAAVNLSGLSGLPPFQGLATAPTVTYNVVNAASAVDSIAAVPNVGTASAYTYVFFGVSGQHLLYWARFNGTAIAGGPTTWTVSGVPLNHTPLGLAAGAKTVFEVYSTSLGVYLQAMSCNDTLGANGSCGNAGPLGEQYPLAVAGKSFFGLAADPKAGAFAVTADWSEGSLWGINTMSPDALMFGDSISVGAAPVDVAVMGSSINRNAVAFAAGDGSSPGLLTAAELSGSTPQFVAPIVSVDADAALGLSVALSAVAASGNADRYAYIGANVGNAGYVAPFTANPVIDGLTAIEGFTVDAGFTVTDGYTVSFTIFAAPAGSDVSYNIYKDTTFGSWTASVASGATVTEGTTVTARVDASKLAECGNVLTVLAKDTANRKGRMAIQVYKDTAPPAPGFSVEFGNRLLLLSLTVPSLCDLAAYEIYYTTDPAVLDYDTLSAHYTPITISSPAAGDKVNETINGLTNGVTYYVYVAAIDTGGKVGLARRSGVPQPTKTLTKLTGESGGMNCLPSLAGTRGDPWSIVWLMVPLLALGTFRMMRRWQR